MDLNQITWIIKLQSWVKIKFFEELGFIEGEAYQTKKLTNTGEYYLGVFEMLYRAHLKTYGNKNNKRVQ